MEERFATYEEAVRYAAERQSEGLFAKIRSEASDGVSGTGYVVRVIDPAEEENGRDPEAQFSPTEQLFIGIIRFAVMALLGIAAGWAVLELMAYLFQGGLVPVLLLVAALGCGFVAMVGWSSILSALVGRSRGEQRSPFYAFGFAFIGAILVGLTFWLW